MAAKHTCTKRYSEICVSHRNWNSDTHCATIHGYARSVEVTIGCDKLSDKGWVMDLGGLRFIKKLLEEAWDHRLLVSDNDPLLEDFRALEAKGALDLHVMDTSKGWGPYLEGSCQFLADHIAPEVARITEGQCRLLKVEIWEKTDNRAALYLE